LKKLDLGQVIGIVANVGVIAGIVLLAVELNQNNALLRNEARYNLHAARTEEIEQTVLNPELGDLWFKAEDGETLTASERRRLSQMMLGRFVRWEWYYEQYRDGLIEQEVLPIEAWRSILLEGTILPEIWKQRSSLLTPDFVEWMEENVVDER
jgi:hypothetical protein